MGTLEEASQPASPEILRRPRIRHLKRAGLVVVIVTIMAIMIDLILLSASRPRAQGPAVAILPDAALREAVVVASASPNDRELRLLLAQGFLKSGHYLSARQEFDGALRLGADEWICRNGRAKCNVAVLRYDQAADDLEQLVKLRPAELETYLALAEAKQLIGKTREARMALDAYPVDSDGLPAAPHGKSTLALRASLLAAAYGHLNEWRKSLQIGRALSRREPDGIAGRVIEGKALHALGQYSEALPMLEAGVKAAPGNGELQYLLGTAFLKRNKQGDSLRAKDCFLMALRADPMHGKAAFELARILESERNWQGAASAYYRAYQLGVNGALPLLRSGDLLLKLGRREEGWYRRGLYYETIGNIDRAAEEYKRLTTLHSCCRSGYVHLARLYAQAHKPAIALQYAEKARQVEPARAKELDMDVLTYTGEAGNVEAQRRGLIEMVQQAQKDADSASYQMAQLADRKGDLQESRRWVERALQFNPKDSGYRYVLGKLLLQDRQDTGKLKEAIHHLEISVSQTRFDAQYFYMLGLAYSYANEPDNAILALRHAIDLEPERGQSYATLAQVLSQAGRKQEAAEIVATSRRFEDFQQTRQILVARVKRNPRSVDSLRKLADFHIMAQEYVAAITTLQSCLEISPDDKQSRKRLADIYGMMGRRDEQQAEMAKLASAAAASPGAQ